MLNNLHNIGRQGLALVLLPDGQVTNGAGNRLYLKLVTLIDLIRLIADHYRQTDIDAVAVENGVYTFQLRHMEKIEMTMPYGVEYIVSEEPEDYDVQITKKVSEEEEQKLDNGKKELSDILSENTDLTFTNTKEVQPATGIRQTSAPYMVMTGAAFGMLAFFGLVYGIRKWGDPTGE